VHVDFEGIDDRHMGGEEGWRAEEEKEVEEGVSILNGML